MSRLGPIQVLAALLLVAALASCGTLGYYAQAVNGHFDVLRQARPIAQILADPATDAALRHQLGMVHKMRDFASRELSLPDNGSYRGYADIGRAFVVWNVFATAEFSTEPKQWCMAVVGCVGYRGYYHQEDAERLAERLRAEGFDVYVAGVPAYSTLGHFDDPVLNTFLRYGELEVARLIFHELAHQVLFVAGDTLFNESFATAVENEGMRRWLAEHGTPQQRAAYAAARRRKTQFARLVQAYREHLQARYAQDSSDVDKRRDKAEILAAMRNQYAELKAGWGGYPGYDNWFSRDLNNAQLASVSFYSELVPVFEALLGDEGGDLQRFYARVGELAAAPPNQRTATLGGMMASLPSTFNSGAE